MTIFSVCPKIMSLVEECDYYYTYEKNYGEMDDMGSDGEDDDE